MRIRRRFTRNFIPACAAGFVLLFTLSGCATEIVPAVNRPSEAHETYLESLEKAGLGNSSLVNGWREASEKVIRDPVSIEIPYREIGFFDPLRPEAVGYKFFVARGRHVIVEFETQDPAGTHIYADLFRIEEGKNGERDVPVLVASKGSTSSRIEFEPRKDGWYAFRLQPELLKGGRFQVTVFNEASLGFPVSGGSVGQIISTFGDPRDGGRRKHEGVDIVAAKGTPVVAPVRAFVSRVGRTEIGGNIVWLWDPERSLRMYFAHLDAQSVESGIWVNPGDTIGTVGNTGNAASTPYHLHFGVYGTSRGAFDPDPFIHPSRTLPPARSSVAALLGTWARTSGAKASISGTYPPAPSKAEELPAGLPLLIHGETDGCFRVVLPDGRSGFIRSSGLEPTEKPLGNRVLSRESILRDRPGIGMQQTGILAGGQTVAVLGTYGSFLFIRTQDGRNAWVESGAS